MGAGFLSIIYIFAGWIKLGEKRESNNALPQNSDSFTPKFSKNLKIFVLQAKLVEFAKFVEFAKHENYLYLFKPHAAAVEINLKGAGNVYFCCG